DVDVRGDDLRLGYGAGNCSVERTAARHERANTRHAARVAYGNANPIPDRGQRTPVVSFVPDAAGQHRRAVAVYTGNDVHLAMLGDNARGCQSASGKRLERRGEGSVPA